SEGVSQDILLACVDPWGRLIDVPTTLAYRTDDPYAVALVFHSGGGEVEWVVSRTLLLQGLATPCGDGDVKVFPSVDDDGRAVAILDFSSPDGRLVAETESVALQTFLGHTFELVPVGAESKHLDMDSLIAALLGDELEDQ
ncbi:SsgA family sporulation/cell division regulator, partial [Nocardioides sp. CER28]